MGDKSCTVRGCGKPPTKKGFCEPHYRKQLLASKPPCTIDGCEQPQVVNSICEKHRYRLRRYNSLELPERAKKAYSRHGLYEIWRWHARRSKTGVIDEWKDFDTFVKEISPPPEHTRLTKLNNKEKLGPGNYEWQRSIKCKDRATYAKIYRKAYPRKAKNQDLMRLYGITLDQYELLSKQQGHKCAICKLKETALNKRGVTRHLAVDHCHGREIIRGLLCTSCNLGLGGLKDDPKLLRAALDYLQKYELE